MTRKQYVEVTLLEWILLSILSVSVTISLAEGFYVPETWSGKVLPALLSCGLVCLYWVLMTFNKKSSVTAIIVFIMILLITVLILFRSTEAQEKQILFLLIASVSATLLYFLSRTRIGTAAVIAAGCMIICGNAFLQYGRHPVLLCLYLPASAIFLMERNYRVRIRSSSTRAPSVLRHTASGVLCCILAAALAGLSMALIIPAQLPTHELKLIKELVRMPVLEKIGTATIISLDDQHRYTDQTNEEKNPTSKEGENRTERSPSEDHQDSDQMTEKQEQEPLSDGKDQHLRAIRYESLRPLWLLSPFLATALVVASILLKKQQRKMRRDRFDHLEPEESAAAYYQYFLHMLSLIRLEDSPAETVREYSRKTKHRTEVLFPGRSAFARLSRDFERIYYGGEPFDEDTRERFQRTYHMLPSLCCKNTGKIRYLFLFFRT